MTGKIYILFGGPSSEREVSFRTKDFFYDNYKKLRPVLVEWNADFTFTLGKKKYKQEQFLKILKKNQGTVVLASHGEFVEDGYIQEVLALSKIPFTGSSSSSSMLSMNKYESAKAVSHIVRVIPTYKTHRKDFDYALLEKRIGSKYPIFVKPNLLGSSIGTKKYNSKKELVSDVKNLVDMDYLYQPAIQGKEVTLGTVRIGEGFLDLEPTEIVPARGFYSYEAKYSRGGSRHVIPARLDAEVRARIRDITPKIHEALGLGFYSRSDFIIDKEGTIYYLETNSLPGMTKTSLLPEQLNLAGKTRYFLNSLIKNTNRKLKVSKLQLKVPYFSQFTVEKNNDHFRTYGRRMSKEGFKESGARTMQDYLRQSDKLCGTACLQMALNYFGVKRKRIFEIYYELRKMGLYSNNELNYKGLDRFLRKYDLSVRIYGTGLTLDEVFLSLEQGKLPVASVRRWVHTHLVLVVGYDLGARKIMIHDPSGWVGKNRYYKMDIDLFRQKFNYRGFVISK